VGASLVQEASIARMLFVGIVRERAGNEPEPALAQLLQHCLNLQASQGATSAAAADAADDRGAAMLSVAASCTSEEARGLCLQIMQLADARRALAHLQIPTNTWVLMGT